MEGKQSLKIYNVLNAEFAPKKITEFQDIDVEFIIKPSDVINKINELSANNPSSVTSLFITSSDTDKEIVKQIDNEARLSGKNIGHIDRNQKDRKLLINGQEFPVRSLGLSCGAVVPLFREYLRKKQYRRA